MKANNFESAYALTLHSYALQSLQLYIIWAVKQLLFAWNIGVLRMQSLLSSPIAFKEMSTYLEQIHPLSK